MEQSRTALPDDDTPSGRRGRKRSERDILIVAEEVFATYGLRGATTAMIAAKADIPKSNIHYYFSTKEALYRRVLEDIMEVWLDAAAFEEADDPREALANYIRLKLDHSRTRPHASRVWANEMLNGAPLIRDHLEQRLLLWVDAKAAIIDGWIAKGLLKPVDSRHLLFLIWSATQHYADFSIQVSLLLRKPALDAKDFSSIADFLVEMIANGVVPAAPFPVKRAF
ncbi:TetR/AcrR family transcriptional regulator [Lacibacterium aquatile]|uniref:TetR/AcrR family transcriptional regulator n=1 Tax=Lacibacterium aquatile TaxID=1168082 RepID=A0ABW5DRQ9_9PROT